MNKKIYDIRNTIGSEVRCVYPDGSASDGPFWILFDELLKMAVAGKDETDEFSVWYFHHVTCEGGKFVPECIFRYYDSQERVIIKDHLPLTELWFFVALGYPLPGW